MENSQKLDDWAEKIVLYWKNKGIQLEAGLTEKEILESGNRLGLDLPLSFIELYKRANGFANWDWGANMFSIWPLRRIEEEYDGSGDKNFVGFCDFLINSHCIGFLKNSNSIFKDYDQSFAIAMEFEEAIELINSNFDLIY